MRRLARDEVEIVVEPGTPPPRRVKVVRGWRVDGPPTEGVAQAPVQRAQSDNGGAGDADVDLDNRVDDGGDLLPRGVLGVGG